MIATHLKFMKRAIQLAGLGSKSVNPNPKVGCVIVHENSIIGEGWHKKAGEAHAEVNAVNSVKDKTLLSESTVYVTLEPCSHYGKTPPCADLLIDHKVAKVVIGSFDPNPKVAGRGAQKLKDANIEVIPNVLQHECESLNKVFFHHIQHHMPYVVLKWAQTKDGFIARETYDSKWISNQLARQQVHKLRSELDAILVGKNTVLYDNPSLDCRDFPGESPLRIVIDHELQLDKGKFNVFNDGKPTLIFNQKIDSKQGEIEYIKLSEEFSMRELLSTCYQKGVSSILVEGGSKTLTEFITNDLWQESIIFEGDLNFKSGIEAPILQNELLVSRSTLRSKENDVNMVNYVSFYQHK